MLATIAIVVALLVVAAKFLGLIGKKPAGRNPFHEDTRRAPEPLVTDQEQRDKVLKQGYSLKKVPENVDAIVIGRYVCVRVYDECDRSVVHH